MAGGTHCVGQLQVVPPAAAAAVLGQELRKGGVMVQHTPRLFQKFLQDGRLLLQVLGLLLLLLLLQVWALEVAGPRVILPALSGP